LAVIPVLASYWVRGSYAGALAQGASSESFRDSNKNEIIVVTVIVKDRRNPAIAGCCVDEPRLKNNRSRLRLSSRAKDAHARPAAEWHATHLNPAHLVALGRSLLSDQNSMEPSRTHNGDRDHPTDATATLSMSLGIGRSVEVDKRGNTTATNVPGQH